MALFNVNDLLKVKEFEDPSSTKALPYNSMGIVGGAVGFGTLGLATQMLGAQRYEGRSIVGKSLHAGTMAPSTAIVTWSSLGASGPEISAELEHFTNSGTPQAERARKLNNDLYDLKKNQTEVNIEKGPLDWITGEPGKCTIVSRKPSPGDKIIGKLNTASIHQPRYTIGQSQPLYPVYSQPYQGDRAFFSPLNLVLISGAFLTSFGIFNMISNKIYNGVWVAPKPLTVFEIIEQLNLKKLTQGQASQLLEKYHNYSLLEAVSVLTGEKVNSDTIDLDQKCFDAKSIDGIISSKTLSE
jgi:hypothetical protein